MMIIIHITLVSFVKGPIKTHLELGMVQYPPVTKQLPLLSFIAVTLKSRDYYEIIKLHKILQSIKQPCSSVYLKKVLAMHQSC